MPIGPVAQYFTCGLLANLLYLYIVSRKAQVIFLTTALTAAVALPVYLAAEALYQTVWSLPGSLLLLAIFSQLTLIFFDVACPNHCGQIIYESLEDNLRRTLTWPYWLASVLYYIWHDALREPPAEEEQES